MTADLISEFLLDVNNPKGLEAYLAKNNYLNAGEKLENLDVAGDGNMNMVLRVVTNHRSYILKQSLAWVHRFPMVKAPRERILTEYDFYQTVQKNEEIKS